jgi:hypothetical protein
MDCIFKWGDSQSHPLTLNSHPFEGSLLFWNIRRIFWEYFLTLADHTISGRHNLPKPAANGRCGGAPIAGKGLSMKRFAWAFLVTLGLFAGGCGGGGEEPAPTENGAGPTTTNPETGAPVTTSPGNFKEGVDSGRNPDGSDEAR